MNKVYLCKAFVAVIYLIFVILIKFYFIDSSNESSVRFCSNDSVKYPDRFLRRSFKLPKTSRWSFKLNHNEYQILRGEPDCGELAKVDEMATKYEDFDFSKVNYGKSCKLFSIFPINFT